MIIVNLYYEEDYDPATDGFHLHLSGLVSDTLDIYHDPDLITDCIENDPDFEPKAGQFYELQLIRGTIASDPVDEPAFSIDRVIQKKYCKQTESWVTPLVRM